MQIGFDFGTSYSKCICRDVFKDKAWVCIDEDNDSLQPFLIPSNVIYVDGRFIRQRNTDVCYLADCLPNLKLALIKIAKSELQDPVLTPYAKALGSGDGSRLQELVECGSIFFLASAISDVLKDIKSRFPKFSSHPEDYLALNLAVPVSSEGQAEVNGMFRHVLFKAWHLSEIMSSESQLSIREIRKLMENFGGDTDDSGNGQCFIYPEVSANVQGFIRSRASSEGIYLFSDTGAGSVDQAVFIFIRDETSNKLTYLSANILPYGSSMVERLASNNSNGWNERELEELRKKKEQEENDPRLIRAKGLIKEEILKGTKKTLALAKKKLYIKDQLRGTRIIFGGGGHCDNPYGNAVQDTFHSNLFRSGMNPDVLGMPIPRDLDLPDGSEHWMNRLSVAYGLSYLKEDLAKFTYPEDVIDPSPSEIFNFTKERVRAPSKDEC
ncbi:hypothetical protein [Desulfoferula mesophila]|uniref:hypothetical protein n=1 Tax=Desulfoferula mesophila TaxID=3058419 RepID=UPI0030CBA533